jgi:hypothetical protein
MASPPTSPDIPQPTSRASSHPPVDQEPQQQEASTDKEQSTSAPQQEDRDVNSTATLISPESTPHSSPDVRYILAGQPTGWAAMAQTVRAYDEDKVKDSKEDIDTLLVFVSNIAYEKLATVIVVDKMLPNRPVCFLRS